MIYLGNVATIYGLLNDAGNQIDSIVNKHIIGY